MLRVRCCNVLVLGDRWYVTCGGHSLTWREFQPRKKIFVSVAMPADSCREKIFDFVREFAVKYFRIVPVRDSTQQNKA